MLTQPVVSNCVTFYRAQFGLPKVTAPPVADLRGASGFVVAPDGTWRAEGLALLRRALRVGLDAWAVGGDGGPRLNLGLTRRRAADAVAAHWGVSRFPLTLAAAVEPLGRSDQFLSDLLDPVVASPTFRAAFSARLPPRPDSLPVGERPWWDSEPIEWPGGSTFGWDEKRALERAVLNRVAVSNRLSRDEALPALREVVATRVMDEYLAHPDHSRLQRTFNGLVLDAWFWRDPGTVRFDVDPAPERDWSRVSEPTRRRLAVMTQLFCHDIALPHPDDPELDEATRTELTHVAQVRGALLLTTAHHGRRRVLRDPPRSELEYVLRRDTPVERIGAALSPEQVREGTGIAGQLDGRAREIRAPRFAETIASLCEGYLRLRADVDWDVVTDPFDAMTIEVADHSVHLDLLRLGREDLLRRLTTLIDATPASARGLAYRHMSARIESLLDARHRNFPRAIARIVHALRALDGIAEHPGLDPKALLESRQQLHLSCAGIAIRIVEATVARTRRPGPHPQARRWAAVAHEHIAHAARYLGRLDSPDIGLGTTRGEDGYVSTVGWRILPAIIRFRVNAVTLVAHDAGLLGDGLEFPVGTLRTLESDYVDLASSPDLTDRDTLDLVRSALWIPALGDGTLPAVPGLVAARAGFLDVPNPEDVVDWSGLRVALDVDAVHALYARLGQDAGAIAKIDPDGVLGRRLTARNVNWFTRLRVTTALDAASA
jgi:hypothetical protein